MRKRKEKKFNKLNVINILNLIFPPTCGFCGEVNTNFLCNKCKNKYQELKISNINDYSNVPVFFEEHYYAFKYQDEIRKLIIKYKFEEHSYLYKTFSVFILQDKIFTEKFINKYDVIISVPIHNKRMKTRGYNQSKLIAKEIAINCGKEYYDNVIIKSKNIAPQSTLDMLERVKNIKEAFSIGKNSEKISGKNVALFDDIFTTGSTVNECAKILKKIGANNVGIFTLAKD